MLSLEYHKSMMTMKTAREVHFSSLLVSDAP